jgi:hypothetical protein
MKFAPPNILIGRLPNRERHYNSQVYGTIWPRLHFSHESTFFRARLPVLLRSFRSLCKLVQQQLLSASFEIHTPILVVGKACELFFFPVYVVFTEHLHDCISVMNRFSFEPEWGVFNLRSFLLACKSVIDISRAQLRSVVLAMYESNLSVEKPCKLVVVPF